jgi:drug/metabolite transporter (DMT)-like permease
MTPAVQQSVANQETNQNVKVLVSLGTIYLVWGSTYLGMLIGLESFPPILLTAMRFWVAGIIMAAISLWRREKLPSLRLGANAVLIGLLTMGAGTTAVAVAEKSVSSGITAMAVAAVPLWAGVFAVLFTKKPSRMEWLGMLIGFSGIVLLNLEDSLQADPVAAMVLVTGPMMWSLGSILSRRIEMPTGVIALVIQMLGAAIVLTVISFAIGEQVTAPPSTASLLAVLYLAVFGSMIGFTAYMYLLQTVRSSLATSYAYVNPIVAVLLGVLFAGESFSSSAIIAMGVILTGVVIVMMARSKS